MFIKETVAISTAIWFVLLASSRAQETKCTELPARNQRAYIGWPVVINGENVGFHGDFSEYDYNDEGDYTAKLLQATMTFKGSGKPFYDLTYDYNDDHGPKGEISNVTTGTPTEIEVKAQELNGSSCVTQTVILQPSQLPDLTCKYASNNTKIILKRERIEGGLTELKCTVYGNDEPGIDIEKYDVTWYYNCDTKLPPNITVLHNKLHFSADYTKHPGIYSCSTKHNEQERFLFANHFCVKPYTRLSVSIICPKKITVYEGGTVNITCDVYGKDSFDMEFSPLLNNGSKDLSKHNISCKSSPGSNRSFVPDERISCIFPSVREYSEVTCFDYVPTRLEWEKAKNKKIRTLQMSYELKKCTTRDAVLMQGFVRNPVTGIYSSCQTTIEVMKRPDRTALIIGAVGFFFILLIVTLCCRFRMQIRCWWRQTSCIKY